MLYADVEQYEQNVSYARFPFKWLKSSAFLAARDWHYYDAFKYNFFSRGPGRITDEHDGRVSGAQHDPDGISLNYDFSYRLLSFVSTNVQRHPRPPRTRP